MSRTSRRSGTKTKCIPGLGDKCIPKYKYPQRSKYHRRKPKATR